jgi:diguanylate cyclase (GGDEF)-like protein
MLQPVALRFTRYALSALLFQAVLCASALATTPSLPFSIDILEVAKGSIADDDITHSRQAQTFAPLASALADLRIPPGHNTWLRIRLTADWPHALPPVLAITPESMMQRMTVYLPPDFVAQEYSLYDRHVTPGFSREGIFTPLSAKLKAGDQVYVKVKGGLQNPGYISFKLDEYAVMSEFDSHNVRNTTIILSIFFTVGLSTLFCWLLFRERILLLYTCQVVGQFIYVLYIRGDGLSLYFPASLTLAKALVGGLPISIYAVFAVLFMREFVELKKFWPKADKVSLFFAALFFAIGLFFAFAPLQWHGDIGTISNILYAVWTPLLLVFTIRLAVQGHRAAWFLLVAWGPTLAIGLHTLWSLLIQSKNGSIGLLAYPAALAFSSVTLVLGVAYRLLQQRREFDLARIQSQYDSLTGVLNRRTAMERLNQTHGSTFAANKPLSVLFVDLDHFKTVNDTHGHAAGDACLKTVVGTLQQHLRRTDYIGRFGGEEFLVVLPNTDVDTAMHLAERMREQVAGLQVPYKNKLISITTSIGVATSLRTEHSAEDIVNQADQALYQAKNEGRNLVRMLSRTDTAHPAAA